MFVKKFGTVLLLGLLCLAASVPVSQAKAPAKVEITTDSPELNKQIASGKVQVAVYEEPSGAEKASITSKLIKMGYTEQELASKPWPIKEYLVSNGLEKAKGHGASIKETPPAETNDFGTATLNPGWMQWTHWGANVGDSYENRIALYGTFDWNSMPEWTLVDKVGFAWASDNGDTWATTGINIVAFHEGCYWDGYFGGVKCATLQVSSDTVTDSKANVGVGVTYDIINTFTYNGHTYYVDDVYGNATALIRRPKNGGTERRQLVSNGEYFHKQGACTFSLSFAKDPSVSVSCAWVHDQTDSLNAYVEYLP
ncbi:MAG: hypothetical protein ACOY94_07580 [Bacillota bacterium]